MHYWMSLVLFIVFYILSIVIFSKYNKKSRLVNYAFIITIFLLYLFCVISIYMDVGFYDWNFQNVLPTANVSPFMYTLLFISILLPENIKHYIFTLVGLLSFPMLCAGLISCVAYIIRDYAFHLTIFVDGFIHVLISIFGVYLVKSAQINFKKSKDVIISGTIILGAAITMLILNLILKTSFFGLSMYDNYSIYNIVLVNNGIVNAIIYLIGLVLVLFIGFIYQLLFNRFKVEQS